MKLSTEYQTTHGTVFMEEDEGTLLVHLNEFPIFLKLNQVKLKGLIWTLSNHLVTLLTKDYQEEELELTAKLLAAVAELQRRGQ